MNQFIIRDMPHSFGEDLQWKVFRVS